MIYPSNRRLWVTIGLLTCLLLVLLTVYLVAAKGAGA
jgi:hypothetical protein